MKVVFPCKGAIVLTKEDAKALEAFYNTNLMTSKVYPMYQTSDLMMQVGNFNYLPKSTTLVLDETKLLSISKMRAILNNTKPVPKPPPLVEEEEKISDQTILSHPFFQTLRPINN